MMFSRFLEGKSHFRQCFSIGKKHFRGGKLNNLSSNLPTACGCTGGQIARACSPAKSTVMPSDEQSARDLVSSVGFNMIQCNAF